MIYILPVHDIFRPASQPFRYPLHNDDCGVEQDFLQYLNDHPELVTSDPERAQFHYLPVFWTRWHFNHNFAAEGRDELQAEVNRVILNDAKTFTVCQYDDGPVIPLGQTIQFLASRKTETGIDIPLLCTPHQLPATLPPKKYLASFTGTLSTHSIRVEMAGMLQNRNDIYIEQGIYDGTTGTDFFIRTILESHISLCPRGYGGSSFRMYESMQLGVVPFIIGQPDIRPFKDYLNWAEFSLYSETPYTVASVMDSIPTDQLNRMGETAAMIWKNHLTYGKWCAYVIQTLRDLTR